MKYDMRESLKGNLIVVLLLLLFLICFGLINAQEQVVTKSRPGDPTLPYVISFTQPATGGNLIITLSGGSPLTGGQTVQSGQMVMVGTTPSTGYLPALGYPKVYRTGTPTDVVSTTITEGARIFKMPTFPVTVEMKYDQVPSGENRLKAVSYTIDDKATTLSNFSSGILTYDITLPTGSTGPVTLTGTRMDGETDVTTTVTPNGSNKVTATLTVTPQSGASKTYTFNFTVAPSESSIVTIASGLAGGTITATLADGKVVKSGDAVANNTVLTLSNTPLKGYDFGAYTVTEGVNLSDDNTVTVSKAVAISATFTAQEEIIPEKIGTPAIPQQPSGGDPIPSENDAPVVIIPDAGALPPDTELSALRLVKDEATEDNQTKVKELATAESLKPDNMQIMEITLVKVVTTTDGATGQETTTVTPVQPGDKVRVRIPYPAGQNKDKADFTVIHLKSDGTTQKYTVAGGNLSLLADYMELTIASFSPFGIAWTPKSDPTPPSYVPTYYNVILPATEGVTFNKKTGKHTVREGEDFSFSLTIQEGYKLYSAPIVRINRNNEIIIPNTSNGEYQIKNIDCDVTITIEGIKKDSSIPTANKELESNIITVRSTGAMLHLHIDRSRSVTIFTLAGQTVQKFTAPAGDSQYTLPRGVYLVLVDDKVFKIMMH